MSINQENQIKTINLTDLKYNKIKKVIGDLVIYNPDAELEAEIENEFYTRLKEIDVEDTIAITVGLGEMLTQFIPLLTNIKYNITDVLLINQILASPSPKLRKAKDEVSEILSEIFERVMAQHYKLSKSANSIINDEDLSPEEKAEILEKMGMLVRTQTPDEEILITDEEIGVGVEDEI